MRQQEGCDPMKPLDAYRLHRHILCIDLKSFYASVECVLRGLDPFTTPLVVADAGRGGGSIVLAVSPYLRTLGIPSRCRIFEIPKNLDIIFARPRMQTYLDYSGQVIETYLEFIAQEDLYIYSVDEAFLDVTKYLQFYQQTSEQLAVSILKRLKEKLGLTATCGIGPNMLMAKLALDIDSKKADNFLAKWDYEDIPTRLWPVTPLHKMWGIGLRMEHHLQQLGLFTIGDIARYDPLQLKAKFGILGEELWYHAHGLDMSLIEQKDTLRSQHKSFGVGQVLFKDYTADEMVTIILEMVDDVTRRLRLAKKSAHTITLSIGYSKHIGGGFSRQVTLDHPTCHESVIYHTCLTLFDTYYAGHPMRTVSIGLTSLIDYTFYQYSLFEEEAALEKEYQLQATLDQIKDKFGKNAVTRLASELKHATGKARNQQIGGHHV